MTEERKLTRRFFLGATAAVPAVAALSACGSAVGPDASVPADGGIPTDAPAPADGGGGSLDAFVPPPDASTPADGSTSGDAYVPEEPQCGALPRIDLRADCGAVGDGMTDDTDAFQRAATMLQDAGGGELTIPAGTYIVGRQTVSTSSSNPYYQPADIFTVTGLSCLKISGYGATIRVAAGLHYGAFDPHTGAVIPGPTTSHNAAAHVGRLIEIYDSADILIEGLELDGNNQALVLGGEWGDTGRQLRASGLVTNRCTNVRVVDVHTHHHGLDGITVRYQGALPDTPLPHTLERVVSEYNGRQGISWIGGRGLTATDCKFNHTGRAINHGGGVGDGEPFTSKPSAGFDIEPNAGTVQQSRDGHFTRCEFIDNAGAGMVAAAGDGGFTTFEDCTFWGTSSYSVWANKPGLKFMNCNFYGTAARAHDGGTPDAPGPNPELATLFEDCTFEDREWTDGNVTRRGVLYDVGAPAQGATWRRCTFTNHQVRVVHTVGTTAIEVFEDCVFVHSNAGLSNGTWQSQFQGTKIVGTHFMESSDVSSGSRNYYIALDTVQVVDPGGSPTEVDGPRVSWRRAGSAGLTGVIPPGSYTS